MNKAIILLIAVLAIQSSFAANITTAGTGFVAVTTATGAYANCAWADASPNTCCTACNPGFMLGNPSTSAAGPTGCTIKCDASCLFCQGQQATPSATAVAFTPDTNQPKWCQTDNQRVPVTGLAYTDAFCRNTTNTTMIQYYTPGTPLTAASGNQMIGTFSCYACPANCINCRPSTGTAPTTAPGTCVQCNDGYYLDNNQTQSGSNAIQGTTCTSCATLPSVNGTTSNSAFIVVATCNKCVNKTGCINATCTRFVGTTAGTGSSDTTSYKFDISKQMCVSGSRLTVAVISVAAVVIATLF